MKNKWKLLVGISAVGAALASYAVVQAQTKSEISFYNWSNYYPPELLKTFEAQTGIKVNLDTYESNEDLLAKLQAGATGYDVIVPSDYMVKIMVTEGILEKIDIAKTPEFKSVLKPEFARVYTSTFPGKFDLKQTVGIDTSTVMVSEVELGITMISSGSGALPTSRQS